ncbi:MAG TPA: DNA replication/repair protein RecF [Chloroflexia bacterium]|nr:DNA replication/repair protein RecF [Chloroflexia bacterium]
MYCQTLTLDEFRNYRHLSLQLSPGVTVIQGDNASGKTTLLEALYLLATVRSPRTTSDLELINFAAPTDLGSPPFSRIVAQVERNRGPLQVEVLVVRDEEHEGPGGFQVSAQARKRIKVNGVARRAIDLVGQANVVLFTPQDVDLVTGPPSLRRRYMDVTISQMDHRYVRLLSQYMKVLAQRNSLLKSFKEQGRSPGSRDVAEEIAYWDEELVKHGSYVILRRDIFTERLSSRAQAVHHLLAGTDAGMGNSDTRLLLRERRPTAELRLHVAYQTAVAPIARATLLPDLLAQMEADSDQSDLTGGAYTAAIDPNLRGRIPHLEKHIEAISTEFKAQLEETRTNEIRRGVSLLGPHRDDLLFQLGEPTTGTGGTGGTGHALELSAYGSRGQQRTAVLALKLAEVDLMTAETGDTPILLLDDIMSELDIRRRGYLLATIGSQQYQALITTTDLAGFDQAFLDRATLLEVAQGEVAAVTTTDDRRQTTDDGAKQRKTRSPRAKREDHEAHQA